MKTLSYIIYELRPFAYALISGTTLQRNNGSEILIFAGAMLAVCSLMVFKWRIEYRYKKLRLARKNSAVLRKSYAQLEPVIEQKNQL